MEMIIENDMEMLIETLMKILWRC